MVSLEPRRVRDNENRCGRSLSAARVALLASLIAAGCDGSGTGGADSAGGSAVGGPAGATTGLGGGGSAGVGAGGTAGVGAAGAGGAPDPFANCDWTLGTGSEVAGPAPTKNNSADLRGPALGVAVFTASTDRRTVPVNVGKNVTGLQIGQAYLTRSPPTSTSVYVTIPVTNTGTGYPCFIQAMPFKYLTSAGTALNSASDSDYLSGGVGDLGGGIYTHSCLAPGETGYFLDFRSGTPTQYFSVTASISVDISSPFAGQAPPGRLTPKQYDIGTCDDVRSVRVTAVNDGTSTVAVAASGVGLGPAILLDTDGLPAGWIYLADDLVADLAAGTSTFFFSGLPDVPAVTRAQLFVDFDLPMMTAALELASAPSGLAEAMAGLRLNRLERTARWRAAADQAARLPPRALTSEPGRRPFADDRRRRGPLGSSVSRPKTDSARVATKGLQEGKS